MDNDIINEPHNREILLALKDKYLNKFENEYYFTDPISFEILRMVEYFKDKPILSTLLQPVTIRNSFHKEVLYAILTSENNINMIINILNSFDKYYPEEKTSLIYLHNKFKVAFYNNNENEIVKYITLIRNKNKNQYSNSFYSFYYSFYIKNNALPNQEFNWLTKILFNNKILVTNHFLNKKVKIDLFSGIVEKYLKKGQNMNTISLAIVSDYLLEYIKVIDILDKNSSEYKYLNQNNKELIKLKKIIEKEEGYKEFLQESNSTRGE